MGLVGVNAQVPGNTERLPHNDFGAEVGIFKQGQCGGLGVGAT